MRLYCLFTVLSFSLYISVGAQTITLDEAISLAHQNNIDLLGLSAKVNHANSKLSEVSRLPNPSFSYNREDLSTNSIEFNEWSALGSVPLNFLWERWSNINSKEFSLNAQKLYCKHIKLKVATDVNHAYFSLHYFSGMGESLKKLMNDLDNLGKSARHRSEVGDISKYEMQRILVELNKIKMIVSEIDLKILNQSNDLKSLIGIRSEAKIKTLLPEQKFDISYSEEELVDLALRQRNDLNALKMIVESEKSHLASAKIRSLPDINLTAGYKQQSDDLKGSVIQVDFELPLFERNQAEIDKSEIDLTLLEKEYNFNKEHIKREVKESLQNYRMKKSLYEGVKNLDYKSLFNTSLYSYEQGETSLVEFIDGINAFLDGIQMETDIKLGFVKSFYSLEKSVGISPIINE